MNMNTLVVGTRVYCALSFAGAGVIFSVNGKQDPSSIRVLGGGVGVSGGNAEFDVVFESGSISRRVPEAIVRGIQWRIPDDELATADEIKELLQRAERVRAEKEASEKAEKAVFAATVERYKSDPSLSHLTQGDDPYSGKLAAKNIRIELKRAFPAVKFSVRKTSAGNLSVNWIDGPTEPQVSSLLSRFKGGYFDGMQDMYVSELSPFVVVFGGADYVGASRDYSDEHLQRAIDSVFVDYAGNLREIDKPSLELFKSGSLYRQDVPGLFDNLQSLIRTAAFNLAG